MGNVFISYKTGDDSGIVNDLHALLDDKKRDFKADRVFLDQERMEGGRLWAEQLKSELADSDILIAAIGSGWLSRKSELNNPTDWVRLELLDAHENGKVILPVLLNGIDMPSKSDIPVDLHFIFGWQAEQFDNSLTIREVYKQRDKIIERLIDAPQKYKRNRMLATANGLVGVLNLVENELTGPKRFKQALLIMRSLVPVYLDDAGEPIDLLADELQFDWTVSTRTIQDQPRIDISYVTTQDNLFSLRVGIVSSTQPVTVVLYEKQVSKNESIVVLIEFRMTTNFYDFEQFEYELSEPDLPNKNRFHTTYQSVFRCLYNSSTRNTRQNYQPKRDNKKVNSEVFSKVFQNDWIGSRPIDTSKVNQLIKILLADAHYTFIHAIEPFENNFRD